MKLKAYFWGCHPKIMPINSVLLIEEFIFLQKLMCITSWTALPNSPSWPSEYLSHWHDVEAKGPGLPGLVEMQVDQNVLNANTHSLEPLPQTKCSDMEPSTCVEQLAFRTVEGPWTGSAYWGHRQDLTCWSPSWELWRRGKETSSLLPSQPTPLGEFWRRFGHHWQNSSEGGGASAVASIKPKANTDPAWQPAAHKQGGQVLSHPLRQPVSLAPLLRRAGWLGGLGLASLFAFLVTRFRKDRPGPGTAVEVDGAARFPNEDLKGPIFSFEE